MIIITKFLVSYLDSILLSHTVYGKEWQADLRGQETRVGKNSTKKQVWEALVAELGMQFPGFLDSKKGRSREDAWGFS